jgi:enoyl-CoA hydratase/carnithine racemase
VGSVPLTRLLYETKGGIATLTFNRPERLNALDGQAKTELAGVLAEFEADPEQRVLILTGSDCGAFSTGSDLNAMAQKFDGGPVVEYPDYFGELWAVSKPIIAAIDGYCVGGGFEMALVCDIRLATGRSSFGLPEPRHGMLGDYGLDLLVRTVPVGEAMRMQLTGSRIGGERAHHIGLVQELAQDRLELFALAHRVANEILECSPTAVSMIKKLVREGRDLPWEYAQRLTRPYKDAVHSSAEAAEGARAFAGKRKPSWSPTA